MSEPALLLLEFDSIARGFEASDAALKEAPVRLVGATPITPGRFLFVAAGPVAAVEYAFRRGASVGGESILDSLFLPVVAPGVVPALSGVVRPDAPLALGVVETTSATGAVEAADRMGKAVHVHLVRVQLSHGLAGKGFVIVAGDVADVEQATDTGREVLASRRGCIGTSVLANPDAALVESVYAGAWGSLFGSTLY